jgi:hypothetical protein
MAIVDLYKLEISCPIFFNLAALQMIGASNWRGSLLPITARINPLTIVTGAAADQDAAGTIGNVIAEANASGDQGRVEMKPR